MNCKLLQVVACEGNANRCLIIALLVGSSPYDYCYSAVKQVSLSECKFWKAFLTIPSKQKLSEKNAMDKQFLYF